MRRELKSWWGKLAPSIFRAGSSKSCLTIAHSGLITSRYQETNIAAKAQQIGVRIVDNRLESQT